MKVMKKPRKSLIPYNGQCVEIHGVFKDFYDHLHYEWRENMVYVPANAVESYQGEIEEEKKCVVDESKRPNLITPFTFVNRGSVIINVEGEKGYEDICEDHMILQCDIEQSYQIPLGSDVYLYGIVGQYYGNNKEGGYDYWISSIINISDKPLLSKESG